MHKLLVFLVILTFGYLGSINGEKKGNEIKESPEILSVKSAELVNLKNTEVDKKVIKREEEVKRKCPEHTDYRSYVECLLEESKRRKRQGYQQCSGAGCSAPVIQPQFCSGNGCLPENQQQCIGNGCLQVGQKSCSGNGCLFFGHNCGGNGCTQIGQNCYGVGCVPANCNGTPCNNQSGDNKFLKEIENIREELILVKAQNEKLIRSTEKTTSFILQLLNRPIQEPKIVREPVLVGHNSTTNIDIKNYLDNKNVVNVPDTKQEIVKEKETNCCVVVRPKTCRRTLRPPHFVCGHKKHRTCGSHCYAKNVVYSHVKQGCNEEADENCVSYHPHPYYPTHGGYPTSAYYPTQYYPAYAQPVIPIYPQSQMPIYVSPPIYPVDDVEEVEDCEDCDSEVETEDCNEREKDCKSVPNPDRGDQNGLRNPRNVHLEEILQVKKEAEAIKRSEDQLTASIDMLKEAVELKKLEGEEEKEKEKSLSTAKPE